MNVTAKDMVGVLASPQRPKLLGRIEGLRRAAETGGQRDVEQFLRVLAKRPISRRTDEGQLPAAPPAPKGSRAIIASLLQAEISDLPDKAALARAETDLKAARVDMAGDA